MWGPLYVQEKLMQYRLEELERAAQHAIPPEPAVPSRWRRMAASAGRTLVRWGTRLQQAAQPEFAPGETGHLAGAGD
jgi:hypothetical protein